MVKHVEGWQLSKSTNQKVYVRSFTGAKVKCMKDYVNHAFEKMTQIT